MQQMKVSFNINDVWRKEQLPLRVFATVQSFHSLYSVFMLLCLS